jgi:hypothetical protein
VTDPSDEIISGDRKRNRRRYAKWTSADERPGSHGGSWSSMVVSRDDRREQLATRLHAVGLARSHMGYVVARPAPDARDDLAETNEPMGLDVATNPITLEMANRTTRSYREVRLLRMMEQADPESWTIRHTHSEALQSWVELVVASSRGSLDDATSEIPNPGDAVESEDDKELRSAIREGIREGLEPLRVFADSVERMMRIASRTAERLERVRRVK